MSNPNERPLDVTPDDFFEIIQLDAVAVDPDAAKRTQTDVARRSFVNNLVNYLEEYNRTNGVQKPAQYYAIFKQVISSRTTETLTLIEAARNNNRGFFSTVMKAMDMEVLRRMGMLDVQEQGPAPVIREVERLFRQSSTFETLAMRGTFPRQMNFRRSSNPER